MAHVDLLESRRLFAAGAIDTSYGGGTVDVRLNAHAAWTPAATDAAIDGAGRVVVAGTYGGKRNQFSVARLTAAGTVDATFGTNGIAAAPLPLGRSGDVDVAADFRGRVLVMLSTDRGVTITRLTNAGTPDKKFGKNGTATVPFITSAADVAVDAGNNVVVIGTTPGKAGTRAAVVRLTYRGKLDATFGAGGVYKAPVHGAGLYRAADSAGQALVASPSGRITCVEHYVYPDDEGDNGHSFGVAAFQLDADGRLRTGYGDRGFLDRAGYGTAEGGTYSSFNAIGPDGRVVLLTDRFNVYDSFGNTSESGDYSGYDSEGQETSSYGFDYGRDISQHSLDAIAIQPDGKTIVIDDADVVRLNDQFVRDPTFAASAAVSSAISAASSRLVSGSERLLLVNRAKRATMGAIVTITAVALA